jgi:NAD(P)-dependent dehydrogenase (short-subunit alcohol dehydrogenase family)
VAAYSVKSGPDRTHPLSLTPPSGSCGSSAMVWLLTCLFDVNVKGQFFTLQKTLPLLSEGASVIFTVGIGATRGVAGGFVTAASRGALLAMMPSLALELAPRKIRVNAVSPGPIDTPIWTKNALPPEARAEVTRTVAARVPLGRFGTAEEVAELVAFLASPAASAVSWAAG